VIPGTYVAGFAASVLYGVPARLPGVALGFPVLLDLERAGAVFAVVAVVSIFAYMTSLGHLPSQFGNVIGYPITDRQHELERLKRPEWNEYTRSMTTRAEPSRLEHLQALMQEQADRAREWRTKMPILRAQSAAASFQLRELARMPLAASPPKRGYADVVLAAPSKEWAKGVADRLRDALPAGAQVDLEADGESVSDGQSLTGFTVRCQVSLAGVPAATATRQVRAALASMEGLEVDYSKPLDLVVVAPSG